MPFLTALRRRQLMATKNSEYRIANSELRMKARIRACPCRTGTLACPPPEDRQECLSYRTCFLHSEFAIRNSQFSLPAGMPPAERPRGHSMEIASKPNVSNPERWFSVVAGAALAAYGLTRRSVA